MIAHKNFITLPWKIERSPPPFGSDEDKCPESLARHFLKEYTKPSDKVFDPFMGLGTTAFVAEETGRIPYGVEADAKRHAWSAGQLENWCNLVHGDSAKLGTYGFPKMDFAITSPPYMPCHHKWNPLYGGDPSKAGYDVYLKRMAHIFKQLAKIMKKNAMIVVQADNLEGRQYTPLVRDMSLAVSQSFRAQTEILVVWKNRKPDAPYTPPYTHCLVFKKT